MKSDNFPTYHFANVVDDHLMKITHVLRGEVRFFLHTIWLFKALFQLWHFSVQALHPMDGNIMSIFSNLGILVLSVQRMPWRTTIACNLVLLIYNICCQHEKKITLTVMFSKATWIKDGFEHMHHFGSLFFNRYCTCTYFSGILILAEFSADAIVLIHEYANMLNIINL